MSRCCSCGADWASGRWTWACGECGGGALEKPCECFQSCGASYRRAVMDSNDYRRAHWVGGCGAPAEEMVERWKRLVALFADAPQLPVVLETLTGVDSATDAFWASGGPAALQVLRDELAGEGLDVPPRVLASALLSMSSLLSSAPRATS